MLELIRDALSTHLMLVTVVVGLFLGVIQFCFGQTVRYGIAGGMLAISVTLVLIARDAPPEYGILKYLVILLGMYLGATFLTYFVTGRSPSILK